MDEGGRDRTGRGRASGPADFVYNNNDCSIYYYVKQLFFILNKTGGQQAAFSIKYGFRIRIDIYL